MRVYCVVHVDDEYGHEDLREIFDTEEKADQYIDADPIRRRNNGWGGFEVIEKEVL